MKNRNGTELVHENECNFARAKEEGREEERARLAGAELRAWLAKHLAWFVIGCVIGGWAASDSGASGQTVFWCAIVTGLVFSFIKWILLIGLGVVIGC